MFEQVIIDNLLTIVSAYRRATGKSMTSISKDFYGRGDFFAKLKQGSQTISIGRLSEMMDKFRTDWPEGTAWPLTRPVLMAKDPQKK